MRDWRTIYAKSSLRSSGPKRAWPLVPTDSRSKADNHYPTSAWKRSPWLSGRLKRRRTEQTRRLTRDELNTIPALGLCGGSALYLFAYVALRLRLSRTLGRGRFVAAVVFALLFPVALAVPALVALALVAAV
jgi:hypothetical protein